MLGEHSLDCLPHELVVLRRYHTVVRRDAEDVVLGEVTGNVAEGSIERRPCHIERRERLLADEHLRVRTLDMLPAGAYDVHTVGRRSRSRCPKKD